MLEETTHRIDRIKQHANSIMISLPCQQKIEQILNDYGSRFDDFLDTIKECREANIPISQALSIVSKNFRVTTTQKHTYLSYPTKNNQTLRYSKETGFIMVQEHTPVTSTPIRLESVTLLDDFAKDFPVMEQSVYVYIDEYLDEEERKQKILDKNKYLLDIVNKYNKNLITGDSLYLSANEENVVSLHCLKADGIPVLLEDNIATLDDLDFEELSFELDHLHVKSDFIFPFQQQFQTR